MAFIILLSAFENILPLLPIRTLLQPGYHTVLIKNSILSNMVVSFVPIVSTLSFSACCYDYQNTKFIYFVCIRTSRNKFILGQIITCAFYGGAIVVIGASISWGIAAIVIYPLEQIEEATEYAHELIKILWLLLCSGSFWSILGMCISVVMENKYMAYASPFIIYYLLTIIYERFWGDMFTIYPAYWINPQVWPYGVWGATIFLFEMCIVIACIFAIHMKNRLQQL